MNEPVEVPKASNSALRTPGFLPFLITFFLTMMADNIEHVLSYWIMFQKFNSPALGGFAVVAHWLPFLLGSVFVGALNDRYDSRRLIQAGGALFMCVSMGWGYFFVTGTLEMWHAMVLLVLHGCAGVLWMTSSQLLLYDIVGPAGLPSAIRLNASARYLGMLLGPGIGSLVMQTVGPTRGIFLNAAIYIPLLIWLYKAPYGRNFRASVATGPKRAIKGIGDIIDTIREVKGIPVLVTMILLSGAASFFIGNSYQAQMPKFATDLGQIDPGFAYSALLGADAAGALIGSLWLEFSGGFARLRPLLPLSLSIAWAFSLGAFALTTNYAFALLTLFFAGFFELSFSSATQILVQLNAPNEIRGRVLGLFNMSSAGLRTFSGLTVGLVGSVLTVQTSLAVAALLFSGTVVCLIIYSRRKNA